MSYLLPNKTYVVTYPGILSQSQRLNLLQHLKNNSPEGVKWIVLDSGATLSDGGGSEPIFTLPQVNI